MTLSPRTLRITAWTAVVTLTLMLVIWFTGPYIVSRVGQAQLTKLLGRTVTFGSVRIEPWDLALSIEDFRMARAAGDAAQGPQLQIRHLRVNMDARSIVRLAPIVEGVVIDDPALHLARTGVGRYDVEDIITRLGAPPPADAPPAQPQRFALFNLKLRGGMVAIDDRPVNRKHELRDLLIDLPFLSNLPADVEVKVQPRLAFSIDGTKVDSGAETTPFAVTQASTLDLKVGDVDLAEWTAYWPANLPVRPKAGHLSVDIQARFELHKEKGPRLSLHGAVRSRDVALTDTHDGALLDWRALEIRLGEVRPLERVAALEGIRLEGPLLSLARDAKGDLNVLKLAAPADPAVRAKPVAAATASAPAAAPAAASAPPPPPDAWRVSLKQVELTDGRVKWDDASTRPAAALALHDLAIRAQAVAWPMAGPVPWTVEATLADGEQDAGHFAVSGEATVDAIRAETQLDGLGLAALDPYLTTVLRRRLEGAVTARVQWQMSQPFGEPQQSLAISALQATNLRLVARGAAPRKVVVVGKQAAKAANAAMGSGSPSLRKLEITDAKLQLDTRRLSIAKVALTEPSIELARDAKGELNLREWLVMPEREGQVVPTVEPAPVDAKPWAISVAEVALEGGRGRWRDAAAPASEANPAYLELEALKVNLKSVSWPSTGTSRLAVSTRLRQVVAAEPNPGDTEGTRRQSQPGRIEWTGDVTPEPLAARGRLVAERVPVHALEPYLHASVPFDLRRADAGFKGTVDVKLLAGGLQARVDGDARVTDMQVFARSSNPDAAPDELLRWQALEVPGLKVVLQPGAKPAIEAGDSTLTDFYAKLLITEQGKLNLSDATGSEVSLDGKTAPAAPPAVGVALGPAAASAPAPEPAAASAPAQPAKPSPVNMSLASLKLVNGHVDFTDHFIRPNYSAALTQLNGRLGTFRSGSTEMAPLELTGIAAGTAQLDIRGSLNPTASPLALDIRAKASDLELAPLSPYAGKYAGYLIERGKLTMDLQYLIKPDGTLTASNQVVLNQLTFGDKVESPDATSLPVRFAVALLKDADGVIDINLPISGSLNDPQFSFGGLIWKVITNLLVKAVTAPFSLLTGGGEQSNSVEFVPGTAYLAPSAVETIERVGKALVARPNLQLTVAGAADPASEREAIQQAALDAMVQAEVRKAQLRAGKPVSDAPTAAASAASAAGAASAPMIASAPPALPMAERERIVREIYQDTKLPNKPRNLVGWPKDLPLPEMEALLRNAQVVSVDSARDLALRRGLAVRDALVAQGLPSERLFQAAPKVRASGEGDTNWKPIVELSLAPR